MKKPAPHPFAPALLALASALLCSSLAQAAEAPASPAAPVSTAATAKKPAWDVNHPPGEAQTVSIDVRSGTWMSVDVSPDGQTLVFDLLGDLYTLPLAGGEARPLTRGLAWDMQARFSPDGKKIVYMSDAGGGDNIWVMNADGTGARALTSEDYRLMNNPVWHPNGQYVLARKHFTGTRSLGSGEIWMYHLDGGKGVQLNEKPNWQKDRGEPAISPDGRFLYYSQDSTPGSSFQYNKDGNGEIFRIYRQDLHDGTTEPFVTGPGGAVRPTPSPDGKYLAFVRRVRGAEGPQSTLFLKDLRSGREFAAWGQLERDLQESWSVHGVYPAFAWMPDAKAIVVWAQGKLWRVDPFKGSAAEIPFHVKDTREIRPALRFAHEVAPAEFDVKQLRWVTVSPDGGQVVYSALGRLYIKDLTGGTGQAAARALGKDEGGFAYYPSFSRDGRELVYVRWDDAALGSVWKLDLATGRETRLTQEPGKYLSPRLSPDGKWVVYQKSRGGYLTSPVHGLETGLYIARADGQGEPLRISKDGTAPQWGRDSEAVYFTRSAQTSEVDSVHKLVRLNLKDRSELDVAKSEFASEFSLSPDGRWLGFVERFHAYVVPLPATGKTLSLAPKMDAVPVKQLDINAGEYLQWSGDGKTLHYALADQLFSVPLEQVFAKGEGQAWKPAEQGLPIGFRAKADKPQGRIAFTGGRIVTMKGNEVIDNGTLLVEGDRIVAVGAASSVHVPADARRVDVSGKTLIPGLIDAHWHGGMAESRLIPQQSWVNYASLAFGLTTIHDPSNSTAEIFTQSEMQRAGRVVGPRIYSTGTILYGAKADVSALINSYEDALTHLKRMKAAGAISVKSYNQPRREQRQQVLAAARETGMMVVPEGGALFQTNMSMVVDGHTGVEHALPVAKVYEDVKQLWPQTAVGYTPTLNVAYGGLDGEHYWYARSDVWRHPILSKFVPRSVLEPRSVRRETAPEEDFNVIQVAKTATELERAGTRTNIGAHGQREGLGAHWEMWMFGLGGMSSLEAIRSATLNPARYLGLDRDIGSLEQGKLADLVVIDGDVLKDIRQSDRISQVMVGGRLYAVPSMNEVAPRQKARKPFFFEGDAAGTPLDADALSEGHGHHGH